MQSPTKPKAQQDTIESFLDKRAPKHLRRLVTLFSALEFGLSSLSLYQRTATFEAAKLSVESSCQRAFSKEDLQMIVGILPDAYIFSEVKNGKSKYPELALRRKRVTSDGKENLTDRIRTFCEAINERIATHLDAVSEKYPEMEKDELNSTLELIEIEKADLIVKKKLEDDKSKNFFEAIRKPLGPSNNSEPLSKELEEELSKPVHKELKSLPEWLIKRVRMQEHRGKQVKEKCEKASQKHLIMSLPALCDQLESYALFHRKSVFPMLELKQNLTRSSTQDKLEEQLNLLENYVPFWISIIYSDGKEYVKLDTSQKYNRVKSTLKQCIATM